MSTVDHIFYPPKQGFPTRGSSCNVKRSAPTFPYYNEKNCRVFRRLDITFVVIFTHVVRDLAHNNGCSLLPWNSGSNVITTYTTHTPQI
jgi:hypothetical protein